MRNVSLYILIRELLYDGKAGLIDDKRPLEPEKIIEELSVRTGEKYSHDKQKWVEWFVNTCNDATKIEKNSLAMTYQIIKAEEKFKSASKPAPNDQ